jgi:hypothetical protein
LQIGKNPGCLSEASSRILDKLHDFQEFSGSGGVFYHFSLLQEKSKNQSFKPTARRGCFIVFFPPVFCTYCAIICNDTRPSDTLFDITKGSPFVDSPSVGTVGLFADAHELTRLSSGSVRTSDPLIVRLVKLLN